MTAIISERRGATLWLTINRPEKRNAINHDVIAGLSDGLRSAAHDAGVRAIVLTGAGDKAFCAGGDMQPGGGFQFDVENPHAPFADLIRLAQQCPLPVIARINGTCVAGGMALLCMADLAIVADHARFGLPEVKMGLFPFQVLALLENLVAPRIVREWCLCGNLFDAVAARAAGLVNHVVPADQLDARTDEMLAQLLANSPAAIRRGKYALRTMTAMSVADRLSFAESQLPLMALSADAKEGLAAFNEKRAPQWPGA